MAVRYSQELGDNLFLIANRLISNPTLVKLLKDTSDDPLNSNLTVSVNDILHKNIKVVPLVNEYAEKDTESRLALLYDKAIVENNKDFKLVHFVVLLYVPLSKWIINDVNLRPFLIISEVEKSLRDTNIKGLGRITYDGWQLDGVDEFLSSYRLDFNIEAFN